MEVDFNVLAVDNRGSFLKKLEIYWKHITRINASKVLGGSVEQMIDDIVLI